MILPEREPFVSWEEIEGHPDYQGLSEDKQFMVKDNWFKKTIESSPVWETLPEYKQNVARTRFLHGPIATATEDAIQATELAVKTAFIVAGGAGRIVPAAIKGARALPAFLKGAGEVGLTLEMMEKGYEVGAWAGGKLTGESEWGRLIGGSLAAGLLPVGAYYVARSMIAREAWPKGKADTAPNWQAAYKKEFGRVQKLIAQPWEKVRLLVGKVRMRKGPDGKFRPVEPEGPSWDDLMKKYGSPDKLWQAEGGMANAARKYRSVYDWLRNQRAQGDKGYQAEAQARAEREATSSTARESETNYWRSKVKENEEIWSKINKAATGRRASGEAKPGDRDYSLTVVEDTLPLEAARETALSGRAGTKPPLVTPEVIITPPAPRPPKAKVIPIKPPTELMPDTRKGMYDNFILKDKVGKIYEGDVGEHMQLAEHFGIKPEDISQFGIVKETGAYKWKDVTPSHIKQWEGILRTKRRAEPEAIGERLEFLGMQRLWEEIKTAFTETKPTTAQTDSAIRPIVDEIKGLFKRFYGLDPKMKRRFTSIEESREIVQDEVLDQIFNKGLPDLTKKESTALTWHRSDPTKYPLPKGRQREANFINETLEFAIQALEKRGMAARWPDSAIKRIQQEIDTLEKEIQERVTKKAKAKRQATVDDLRQVIEELKVRRYVPHIAVPSFTKKILGIIQSVKVGGWRLKEGEKLSSHVKRFLGRKTLSLEEFVEAAKKRKIEPELDIRVLLADYLNYTMDKVIVYDEVEIIKQMPELVLPVEEMPSDWKAIKGVKQLHGYGAHPFMADAITEFTGEYATRNMLLKGYDSINRLGKFIVFYNPMIMTINDLSQIYMGGALLSKEMGKSFIGFSKPQMDSAVKDVITRSPLMKESQRLGLFSTPWRGAPKMIEMARMWAAHVESTKPEWHKRLEKAVGKEINFEEWMNPIIAGKDAYDMIFKTTWTLDRIWRMTQVRNFMEKGMSLPDAVERTRKLMVQYDYLPNRTRAFLNRIFLTPTYRVGMMRLYGNFVRHPAEKIGLPYKGVGREKIPWEERMGEGITPENWTRENAKAIGRYALLKFLIYVGAPLLGYTWLESYRVIKRKETGEEEIFTLPGPIFELEKLFGRAWTNSLYLNLARIPYILASINPSNNRDWKGDQIVDYGAPTHVIGGQIVWYITKTYLAPLERFEMLGGDEQDAIGKALSFLAISKYTRQSPHAWRGYQIYKANREYVQYINPRKPDGTINEKKRPSPKNQVRAYEKWREKLEDINEGFNKRQQRLSEPIRENLFWQIFLGRPEEAQT